MDDKCLNKRILRVDGKTFMEQYSQAVLANKMDGFFGFYSDLDGLCISEIKCWANKQKVQKVFLKIAQILLEKNKLVCLEPDCGLEESVWFDQQLKNLIKS